MEGKVKVIVEFEMYGNLHFESLWVHAWADVESVYEEGYSDRPGSYHDEYTDVTVDIVDLHELVKETYGDIDYTYEVDEDSFEGEW